MSATAPMTAPFETAGDFTQAETMRRLARLTRFSRFMDTAIAIPGTSIRFGADSILGLVPGVGDAAGGAIGLFIVNEARKLGLPKRKIARMLANVGTDAVVGTVRLLGDVFDIYFKAHKRNVQIILDHFDVAGTDLKDVTPKR